MRNEQRVKKELAGEVEFDDRINVRIGEKLKNEIEKLVAMDPGDPGIAVIVRRLLTYGLEHQERNKKGEK